MNTPRRTRRLRLATMAAASAILLVTGCDAEIADRDARTQQVSTDGSDPPGTPIEDADAPEPGDDETDDNEPEADQTDQPGDAATTDADAGGPGQDAASDDPGDVLDTSLVLLLDASKSMNERDVDGQTRLAAAKDALYGLVDELPDDVQVGLRLFGHTYEGDDTGEACADTELVHPVGPLDRSQLRATIDEFEAVGHTPIARSLSEAVDDLPDAGQRTIVLVSDGEETCAPPPPCEVAQEIADRGIDLAVHTVGFALGDNDDARSELSCVADATDGTYRDAGDAAELAETVNEAADEAGPQVLEGAPFPDQANTGQVSVTYTDTVGGDERNYYRFDTEPDMQIAPHFRREAADPDDPQCYLRTRLTMEEGDRSAYVYDTGRGKESVNLDYLEHIDNPWTTSGDSLLLRIDTEPRGSTSDCDEVEFEIMFRMVVWD
ncbi:VWA domain-containing protein [Actinobacteria bacterium YIM 96077]|uniref:VWFA domain-containing protein n=1 Tax=Phytoactinopolyspora halophila TaxID=1981511 RepID=A0A329QM45_9ACTN|nr:VWA domain-containing protein [Phytoactinopolyspora halophila]AYY12962.1 VWA domain-containing protein [Actinobacteria bacterium YIM 96077]RAW13226.1 hypothetical protein DPM12_12855 [Phytoactinopolyspora halophila]